MIGDVDLFGEPIAPPAQSLLAKRFIVPPFSVLSARDGDWQERKRQWLALGIKSELGRGEDLAAMGGGNRTPRSNQAGGGYDAVPGGAGVNAAWRDFGRSSRVQRANNLARTELLPEQGAE